MPNPAVHLKSLEFTRLFPAPHVLIKLIDLCHTPDVSIDELDNLIKKDPALCAKVLTIANSAAFSQLSELHDLKQVLVVLGTRTIKSIALTSAVHQFFSLFNEELGNTMGCLWLDALVCAQLTRRLAVRTDYRNPDEAYLVGLLHQMGQLVMLSQEPEQYQQIIASASDQTHLLQREQQLFGSNHAHLAADIAQSWGLDIGFTDAIRYQYQAAELLQDTHPLVKLVNLASRLCNRRPPVDDKHSSGDDFFGLPLPELHDLQAEATQAAIADAKALGITVDDQADQPRATIDDESIRILLARKIRQIALLEGMQQQISELNDLSDMLQLIGENLHMLFGLSSMLFFAKDKEHDRLTSVSSHRNRSRDGGFSIQMKSGRSLVSDAGLQQRILSSSRQDNSEEQRPVVDRQVMASLNAQEFICLPLINRKTLLGVIAVGNNPDQAEQLQADEELLKHFSTIIADALGRQQQARNEYQQQLQQKQLEIDLHTRKIIHEVNNPLTIINNYLEILSIDMAQDSNNAQHLETIKSEVNRVGEILLQLKVEQSQAVSEHPRTDVNKMIQKLIDIFSPTFYKQNHIKSILELDPSMPEISIDQNRLKQIITNLVKNAVEALTDQGVITIKTRALVIVNKEQFIEITVSDNGPGIATAMLPQLFSPVHSEKGAHHSGLGLTIVNKLVSELQGRISYSTSPSGGAEFNILLPINGA